MRPRLWGWGTGAARCPSETNDGAWFDEEPPMESQRRSCRMQDISGILWIVVLGLYLSSEGVGF
jgi:phage terminase large subunit-like protein